MHVLSTPPAFVLSQDQTLRECFPVIGMNTTRAERPGRNKTGRSQRPRCVSPTSTQGPGRSFQRNHQPAEAGRGINISGVDFWHAVEFSRNGRFLRSRFTGALRALPFVLAFPTLSDSFVSDSRSKRVPARRLIHHHAFQFFAFAFPFPAVPTLSDPFGPDSQSAGFVFPAVGPFRRVRL